MRTGILLLAALGIFLPGSSSVFAAPGDSRAGMFVGTTTVSASDTSTFGTAFGAFWGYEVKQDILLILGGTFSSTDGEEIDSSSGLTVFTSAKTAAFHAGGQIYFNNMPDSLLVPFAGGGVSLLNYDVDYPFTNSVLGTTSGITMGVYGDLGLEIWFADSVNLIIKFGLQAYPVKSENRRTEALTSGGLSFALRIKG